MTAWSLSAFVGLVLLTVTVGAWRHGGHGEHGGHGGHHPPHHDPDDWPHFDENGNWDDSREHDKDDDDHDGGANRHAMMAAVVVLGCLLVLCTIASVAFYFYKKKMIHNKIAFDQSKTPTVSVISRAPVPPPYEPMKLPKKLPAKSLPSVEGTAPPGYSYIDLMPPKTPPPPYEMYGNKLDKMSHK